MCAFFVFTQRSSPPSVVDSRFAERSVAATIFPLVDFAQGMVPDGVKVIQLLPPGVSPHTFEPTPSLIRSLSQAQVLYAIGHGLDDWAISLAESVGTPVVIVDQYVHLRVSQHEEDEDGHEAEREAAAPLHNGPVDPHYWLHPDNASKITQQIKEDLAERFVAEAKTIYERGEQQEKELIALGEELRAELESLEQRHIVTLHDAWYYFADALNLTVIDTFEPTAGREPTAQDLAKLSNLIDTFAIHVLYSEPQLSTEGLRSFAKDHELSFEILDPIGGESQNDSYESMMRQNVEHILKQHERR